MTESEASSARSSRVAAGAVFAVLLAGFALLKSYSLHPAASDENIYFYDAVAMTKGLLPYRDFFFAHPPLHLIPGWLLFSIAGFSVAVGKLLPVLAAAGTGAAIYRIGLRASGPIAAVTGAALFLYSYDLLRASSHWTGINWAVAWYAWALAAALGGRPVVAGMLAAIGACTGFYIFPAALMIGVLLFVGRGRRNAFRYAVGFVTVFGGVNLVFWIIGGSAFINGVYRYHFMKPPQSSLSLMSQLPRIVFHNFVLLSAPLALLPVLLVAIARSVTVTATIMELRELVNSAHRARLATALWALALTCGYLAFLGMLGRVYHFYFLLLFPTCAIAGGLLADYVFEALRSARSPWTARVAALTSAGLLATGLYFLPRIERTLAYWPTSGGTTRSYTLPANPVLPSWLDASVRRILWSPERHIGRRYSGLQFYLWHESRTFAEAATIADSLVARLRSGDAMFGDSTTAPLIALLAGIPLADGFADTNAMRFRSGITPPREAIARLRSTYNSDAGALRWILLQPQRGFVLIAELREWVASDFKIVERIKTRHHGEYLLLERSTPLGAASDL